MLVLILLRITRDRENMCESKKKSYKDIIEIKDIVVEWKYGNVKGFRSTEEAERFINQVCKKAAPGMEYSISFAMTK